MNHHESLVYSLQSVTSGAEALPLCAAAAEAILHMDRELACARVSLMNLSAFLSVKAPEDGLPPIYPEAM